MHYDILQLLLEVFVVEQNCLYQDLQGIDKKAMHSWIDEEGKMVAYARFFMGSARFCVVGRRSYTLPDTQRKISRARI